MDLANPFFPLQVAPAGVSPGFGLFASQPTEGQLAAIHGFDGEGPGSIQIFQEVVLPAGSTTVELDYRAGWDLLNYIGELSRR